MALLAGNFSWGLTHLSLNHMAGLFSFISSGLACFMKTSVLMQLCDAVDHSHMLCLPISESSYMTVPAHVQVYHRTWRAGRA